MPCIKVPCHKLAKITAPYPTATSACPCAQDAEAFDARQSPGSCRNTMSVQLVSSNGTAVPVKASISHHPGSLSQGATWAVAFTRSSQAAADDERRLLLRIMLDGTIVAVSRGTPSALFGVEPSRVVGTKLEHLVDVCWEYSKGGEPRAGRGKWRQAFVVSCNTGGMEFVLAASSTTCTWLTGATH